MVEIKQRTLRDIDWLLLITPIALVLFGCIGIKSTAPAELNKQLVSLGIGIALALVAMFSDYRKVIVNVAPFFYAAVLVMLILVLLIGVEVNGNKAWLRVAGFSLQPSEFAKLATILMLARYMTQPRQGSLNLKDMLMMGAIAVPPIILIQLENDTGTMLTFGAILGAFFFLAGMRKLWMAAGIVAVIVGLVFVVYPHLKGYQRQRVDAVLYPDQVDPKGYAYQTIQSVIAVGSGGVGGKGIGEGTQGKLGFLPFAWTDFIAAVIAEEMGLMGVLAMMGLYLIFIWRLISVAVAARDRAGSLMIMAFVCLISFHILCNLGMVVGIMPIMGIPLPLMSSGGTAVMATFIGIGLALSVRLRRFVN